MQLEWMCWRRQGLGPAACCAWDCVFQKSWETLPDCSEAVVQVVKVLHGADSDIVWLQRDFGIYVANLFDTGQAARVLGFPSAGLAYLLSRFCAVKVAFPHSCRL